MSPKKKIPVPAPSEATEELAPARGEEARVRGRRGRRDVELEGLKQMALVWLWVSNLRAAVSFYREQVGLRLGYLDEESGWAFFGTGAEGVDLGLKVWPFGGAVPRGGGACPVFEVTNLGLARAAMEARGVAFEGTVAGEEGVRRLTTFHDLDGNPLMLTQVW